MLQNITKEQPKFMNQGSNQYGKFSLPKDYFHMWMNSM